MRVNELKRMHAKYLSDELDDTTSFLDFLLSESRDVAGLDDERRRRQPKEQPNHQLLLFLQKWHSEGMNVHSVSKNLAVTVAERVDNGDNLRVGIQTLLLRSGDKAPELVDVDNRPPVGVARKVVVAHTNLSEVTRMELIEVGTESQIIRKPQRVGMRGKRTGGGADHQRDHDLLGACGAFLHDRDRQRHDRGACGSSRIGWASCLSDSQKDQPKVHSHHQSHPKRIQHFLPTKFFDSNGRRGVLRGGAWLYRDGAERGRGFLLTEEEEVWVAVRVCRFVQWMRVPSKCKYDQTAIPAESAELA